jgi:sugar lactone lactonase YvrE
MTAEFNADALAPCEEANIGFASLPHCSYVCGQVGSVYVQAVAPESCYATGKGLEVATVKEKALASLYALDHHGKPFARKIERMMCKLASEIGTNIIDGSIRKVKDNQYEISYCPISRGRHRLHIKFDSKHIKKSPFTVTVRTPIKKLGIPIMTITGLSNPWGVTVNKKGEIIIAENNAHRVSVYSQAGEKLRSFGSFGSGEGQLWWPRGVAVDDDDNILVADSENNRIQKFSADGQFITVVGKYGVKPLHFNGPTGIAIHPINKRVYVSDSSNHRVQILNSDLTAYCIFGSEGFDKGQLYCPGGIAFDSKQNVYIGRISKNTYVQVFTADGEHLRWVGDTKLNCPFDVGIDSNDMVYVCDRDSNQICSFDSNGTLLHAFGTKGKLPGQFNIPSGLSVDRNGLIYVCDCGNGRVQVF